jgi:hypothetical protein
VHDVTRFIHEPLRLNVFIAAPTEALNYVIAKHQAVRDPLDNRWLHLFAIADDGSVSQRYGRDLRWTQPDREDDRCDRRFLIGTRRCFRELLRSLASPGGCSDPVVLRISAAV